MRMTPAVWLTALAAVTTTVTGRGPLVAVEQNDPHVAALLEPIRVKHHLPALGGAIVTSQGLRSLGVTGVRKTGADVAATADDLWHLGSDTKAMTAVVLAKLVEQGKLTWDTTIEAVLPKQVANAKPAFGGITLLQLLSHRAGLVANFAWPQIARTPGSPREQRLAAITMGGYLPLSSTPGTKYEYSNAGYVIAATMAETVADRAWEDMIRDVVFKPLGMASVGFGGTGTPGQIDQPWPHQANGQPMPANGPDVDNPAVMGPAGTVHCSLSDWSKFIVDQLRGLQGHGALLKPESYKSLHTAPFGGNYSAGWLIVDRPWAGGTAYTHAGSNTMNYAVVWMAPLKDFAVLVVTNQGGPQAETGTDEAASALILRQISKNQLASFLHFSTP
jgi:CubicO group peptidase (beta-lactamase class C family)